MNANAAAIHTPTHTPTYTLWPGRTPLLVSVPHAGRHIPDELKPLLVERALAVEDTDWHLERLYDFARELGASLIVPVHSRYVVDLNRPPENTPMYPGTNNTGVVPLNFFSGDALYREGMAPNDDQVQQRVATYWRPYHAALTAELARLKAQHGYALLWEGHSIRSELPWLFEGRLPDLNLGTVDARSCAPSLRAALQRSLAAHTLHSHVFDDRFKGGHITRAYGRPQDGVHAVQLEMVWDCYMAEQSPYVLDPQRVAALDPVLRGLVQTMLAWRPDA